MGEKREIVAEYDYTDEHGEVLYQAVRFEPKGFAGRRPVEGGGWEWNLQGCRRVLYRLPELLKAPMDKWVFIVEGEKDADRLHAIGCVATCNVGGAGKWRDDYASSFEGRKVAIIPDNDRPGREHAEAVFGSVTMTAEQVVILALSTLDTKDVSDWLDAGGSREKLWEELQKALVGGTYSDVCRKAKELSTDERYDLIHELIYTVQQDGK